MSICPACGKDHDSTLCPFTARITPVNVCSHDPLKYYISCAGCALEKIASLEGDNEILRNMNKILKDSVEALAAGRDRLREEMPCRRCGIRKYGYCEECKTLQGEEGKDETTT